jgi:uncharacterized protein Yka (UPF0111/DUF47 family)
MPDTTLIPINDPGLLTGLLIMAITLVKIIDKLIDIATNRFKKNKGETGTTVVQLDPEMSKMISTTSENVRDVHAVMGRVDKDGTPMVYSSRSGTETLREIVMTLRDIASSQERLAASLDKMETRAMERDREDMVTLNNIQSSADRIERKLDDK